MLLKAYNRGPHSIFACLLCSYTLAGLLELADISLPEGFGEDEMQVAITGLQNRSHKVSRLPHARIGQASFTCTCALQILPEAVSHEVMLVTGMHMA